MIKKIFVLLISISYIVISQSNVKSDIINSSKNILSIPNYKSSIYMQVTVEELKSYFENLDVKFMYLNKKNKTIIDGVPELPNQEILTALLKNAIAKAWDYLTFPYLYNILFNQKLLSNATIEKLSNKYWITVNLPNNSVAKITKAKYLINEESLPEQIQIFLNNGTNKMIKLGFNKIEKDRNLYVIDKIYEEAKSQSGQTIYKSNTEIKYNVIENMTLPSNISYSIQHISIQDKDFKTTIDINYKAIKAHKEGKNGKKNRKKTQPKDTQDSSTSSGNGAGSSAGKASTTKRDLEDSNKAECKPKKSN